MFNSDENYINYINYINTIINNNHNSDNSDDSDYSSDDDSSDDDSSDISDSTDSSFNNDYITHYEEPEINKVNENDIKNICKKEHMNNNFKIKCLKCNKIYNCSKCHNESEDHKIEKKYNILCNYCNNEQKYSKYCNQCENILETKYVCNLCFIYDNNNTYKYHCNKCNICHQEEKQRLKHCKKCNICYLKNNIHNCIEKNSNCAICLDELINNTIINLKCGHIIHQNCYDELIKTTYKCPLCYKSITDMTEKFKKMDNLIENDIHIYNTNRNIYCYDCEKKSKTNVSNIVGTKCLKCNSYNTRIEK
jgi:hypothetical protein